MKDVEQKKLNSVKHNNVFSIFLLSLFAVILVVATFMTNGVQVNEDDTEPLYDGWTVDINDEHFEDVALMDFGFATLNKGDHVEMSKMLHVSKMDAPTINLYAIHSVLTVRLDGITIYRYGQDLAKKGKMLGYGYHRINLPQDYAGKLLEVSMDITEDDAFSTLDVPVIYNGRTMFRDYIFQTRIPFFLNLFLIMFGFIMALISITLMFRERRFFKLFCTGMFALCVGCWSFVSYNLSFVLTDNLLFKTYMEYHALYVGPIFIFLYFKDEGTCYGKIRKAFYYIILTIESVFLIVGFSLQIINYVHAPRMLKWCHAIMIMMAIYILTILIVDLIKRRNNTIVLIAGILMMLLFVGLDLLRFYISKYVLLKGQTGYQSFICIGTTVFVLAMVIHYIQDLLEILYKSAKNEMFEKLAYTDAMTGLDNRRSCEILFDEIDEENSNYGVIVFDLNDLKKVNDSMGHEEGDHYIITFGRVLKNCFSKFGLVARTGGDEFIVIFKDTTGIDIDGLLDKMQGEIAYTNEHHSKWNMSYAYGVATRKVDNTDKSRVAFKLADTRMYENKVKMKKVRL